MEDNRYARHLEVKEKEFEDICKRCGSCCGADDDPCRNLTKLYDGTYYCSDYKNRLRRQKTVSGKSFQCIPIRQHIANDTLRPGCAYRGL